MIDSGDASSQADAHLPGFCDHRSCEGCSSDSVIIDTMNVNEPYPVNDVKTKVGFEECPWRAREVIVEA